MTATRETWTPTTLRELYSIDDPGRPTPSAMFWQAMGTGKFTLAREGSFPEGSTHAEALALLFAQGCEAGFYATDTTKPKSITRSITVTGPHEPGSYVLHWSDDEAKNPHLIRYVEYGRYPDKTTTERRCRATLDRQEDGQRRLIFHSNAETKTAE